LNSGGRPLARYAEKQKMRKTAKRAPVDAIKYIKKKGGQSQFMPAKSNP